MLFITKLHGKIEIAAASAIRVAIEIPFLFECARSCNWKIDRDVSTVPFVGKTQNDKMIFSRISPAKNAELHNQIVRRIRHAVYK